MRPLNSRAERAALLRSLQPAQFARYEDYYFAFHLNPAVQWTHVIAMLCAYAIAVYALLVANYWLFILYLLVLGGTPQVSHWIFDGFWSHAVQDTQGTSVVLALRLNFGCLFGKQRRREAQLLSQYPFLYPVYGHEQKG